MSTQSACAVLALADRGNVSGRCADNALTWPRDPSGGKGYGLTFGHRDQRTEHR